jgi:hypothetical protein
MSETDAPPGTSKAQALHALLPHALESALARTFRCMEVAEEEIATAKERRPEKVETLDQVFGHLCPPALLSDLSHEVYRAHCRELLERAANGEKLRLGTAAEVVAALSRFSQVAPPGRIETLLYMHLFERLFPGELARLLTEAPPMRPDSYERDRMNELEHELRRKVAKDRERTS